METDERTSPCFFSFFLSCVSFVLFNFACQAMGCTAAVSECQSKVQAQMQNNTVQHSTVNVSFMYVYVRICR